MIAAAQNVRASAPIARKSVVVKATAAQRPEVCRSEWINWIKVYQTQCARNHPSFVGDSIIYLPENIGSSTPFIRHMVS
jgi:hypothetical protein